MLWSQSSGSDSILFCTENTQTFKYITLLPTKHNLQIRWRHAFRIFTEMCHNIWTKQKNCCASEKAAATASTADIVQHNVKRNLFSRSPVLRKTEMGQLSSQSSITARDRWRDGGRVARGGARRAAAGRAWGHSYAFPLLTALIFDMTLTRTRSLPGHAPPGTDAAHPTFQHLAPDKFAKT